MPVNRPCKCAADFVIFFGGANLAQDTVKNLPPILRLPIPEKLQSSGELEILKQCFEWMEIGIEAMPFDCAIDTGEIMTSLKFLRSKLGSIRDEDLSTEIKKLTDSMNTALEDCMAIEQKVLEGEVPIEQNTALRSLGAYKVLRKHDDGDMTIMTGQGAYMVTTRGQVFKEVSLGG